MEVVVPVIITFDARIRVKLILALCMLAKISSNGKDINIKSLR